MISVKGHDDVELHVGDMVRYWSKSNREWMTARICSISEESKATISGYTPEKTASVKVQIAEDRPVYNYQTRTKTMTYGYGNPIVIRRFDNLHKVEV